MIFAACWGWDAPKQAFAKIATPRNLEYIGTNAELIIQSAKVLHDDVFEQEPDTPLSELYPALDKLYALLWLIGDEGLKLEVMAIRAEAANNPVAAFYYSVIHDIGNGGSYGSQP